MKPALRLLFACPAQIAVALAFTAVTMVKKHIAPGGFPFAENAILEGLEGDVYMRRTIEEIQQSTAKMRAKRESSMAHEIAKIRMRQDAVAARRGPSLGWWRGRRGRAGAAAAMGAMAACA